LNEIKWDLLGTYLLKISGKLTAFKSEIDQLCTQLEAIKSKQKSLSAKDYIKMIEKVQEILIFVSKSREEK
jgi:hypothetical protein